MLCPYGTSIPGFDPVILVGVIDPTLWPALASLTHFILFGSSTPAPTLTFMIQLIGWKLYPVTPCDDAVPALEAPHVKRAV